MKFFSSTQKAYLAGFLDGDGSIYVRIKPNKTYRYGFQVAPSVILFQSSKGKKNFEKICSMIKLGYLRERNDGVLEYTINRVDAIRKFLLAIQPYLVLKQEQAKLMLKILSSKEKIKNQKDFIALTKLIAKYAELNYSKKRKNRKEFVY